MTPRSKTPGAMDAMAREMLETAAERKPPENWEQLTSGQSLSFMTGVIESWC